MTAFDKIENEVDAAGMPFIKVKGFKPKPVPLFLEGPVRHMKVMDDKAERQVP